MLATGISVDITSGLGRPSCYDANNSRDTILLPKTESCGL